MSTQDTLFGKDLRLLRDLRRQSSRLDGNDLSTTRRTRTGQVDLEALRGRETLSQALLLRFMTPVGELTHLGHPTYGSRLVELVGELNSQTTRNRAKLFALQALAAEPRVREVDALDVRESPGQRNEIRISALVRAIDSDEPFNLVFDFALDGELAT